VASGAAAELDDLRTACAEAIDVIFAADPDLVVVVGGAQSRASYRAGHVGTFKPYGVDISVALGGGETTVEPDLPLSLTVAAWLLRDRPLRPERVGEAVPFDLPTNDCVAIGSGIAGRSTRVGLMIMADGSARRGEKSPGYADDRAESFDAGVTSALAAGETAALTALDPDLAAELMVAGRSAWQVLAGAAGIDQWHGRIYYDAAPYGVQYTVATWTPA
jgi:hypothetical protein